ncbi:MAG TPA: hypothetical protein VGM37_01410 [Armatimonadota bacterium]|jgi:hypothetical protein
MPYLNDSLSLYLDTPAPAVDEPGVGDHIGAAGVNWSTANLFTTPDRRGVFLQPIQYDPAWRDTTTAGTVWARHPITDFGAISGAWDTVKQSTDTDYWCSLAGAAGSFGTTGANWTGGADGKLRANPHIVIEAYLFGLLTNAVLLTVEWGAASAPYAWKLTVDGVGNGVLYQYDSTSATFQQRASGVLFREGLPGRLARLWIAPIYRRCLYVFGRNGESLSWLDDARDDGKTDHVASDAADPLVATGTVRVTLATRGSVQVTEAAFQSSGTMDATLKLPYTPTHAATWNDPDGHPLHWQDAPSGSTVAVTAPGWAASSTFPLHAVLTASTDRRSTPTLYATGFHIPATVTSRGDNADATWMHEALVGLRVDVREGGSSLSLPLRNADAIRQMSNFAVALKCGSDEVWRGYATDPQASIRTGSGGRVTFGCEDEWNDLNGYILPRTERFDGWRLTDAMKAVLAYCGRSSSEWDIDDSDFRLPSKGSHTSGTDQAAFHGDDATPAGDLLRSWGNTYLGWVMDFARVGSVVKFRFKNPYGLSATPAAYLYTTTEAAFAAALDDRFTINEWDEQTLPPEANEVLVIGQSPAGKELTAWYRDSASQNPALTPSARPLNWIGKRRVLLLSDANLCTQADVNAACKWMAWVCRARLSVGFKCHWLPWLRYGDCVVVDGISYVLKEFSFEPVNEGKGEIVRWMSGRLERFL